VPDPSRLRLQLQGVALLVVLALIAAFAVAMFNGTFTRAVTVTLAADRSGLLMNAGAKVKIRNIIVGKVADVRVSADGGSVLTLDLDPTLVRRTPANVTAEIDPSTIFGPKAVSLVLPSHPVDAMVADGDVIGRAHPALELDTVYENFNSLLRSIQPGKLNAALGALATALQGRGDELGDTAVDLEQYLHDFNPSLPRLEKDLQLADPVLATYADASPDLLRILSNATVTSKTIVSSAPEIGDTLTGLTGLARTGHELLADNEINLTQTFHLLDPVAGLLAEYSPEFPCFLQGVATINRFMEPINGGRRPGISMLSSFLPGQEPYKNPRDLPVVGANNPPNCYHLPYFSGIAAEADHIYFNDGSTTFGPGSTDELSVGRPPLAALLFGPNGARLVKGVRR
jgi:phospholipid/cholesterol/gamma-HCH transport system substrate-binding protein